MKDKEWGEPKQDQEQNAMERKSTAGLTAPLRLGNLWCSLLGFTVPGTPKVAQSEVQHKVGLSSYS